MRCDVIFRGASLFTIARNTSRPQKQEKRRLHLAGERGGSLARTEATHIRGNAALVEGGDGPLERRVSTATTKELNRVNVQNKSKRAMKCGTCVRARRLTRAHRRCADTRQHHSCCGKWQIGADTFHYENKRVKTSKINQNLRPHFQARM